MLKLVLIALGGSLGALARYGMAGAVQRVAGLAFPWGTLIVNVTGCLLIGFLWHQFERAAASPEARALVLIGFLGAYTTFSTFGLETINLLREGAALKAGAYVVASNVVGLAAVWVGLVASRAVSGSS